MSKLIIFMAAVGAMYLFDALWEFIRTEHKMEKLGKFVWICVGVVVGKLLVKAVVWAVNL
jgi:hypothetical protein